MRRSVVMPLVWVAESKRATIIAFKGEAQGGGTARGNAAQCVALWASLAVALSAYGAGADEAGWTPHDESDGIAVFTRRYDGSVYPEVRARGVVCATLPQLVAFVEDVASFERWIPDTAEARLLEPPSARSQLYYIRTSMPWPVKDRDMVYRLSESTDASAAIAVGIEGLPDYLPADPHAVRMTGVKGRWSFVEQGGRTRINLDMHIEPGGGVPTWLAKQRIVGTPTKMLKNLQRQFASSCVNH